MNNINEEYDNMLQEYINLSLQILVTKKCGYKMLYLFGEKDDCLHLIKRITDEFPGHNNKMNKFWIIDNNGNRIDLPMDNTLIKTFIANYNIKSYYPLSHPTVYQIFFDDHN